MTRELAPVALLLLLCSTGSTDYVANIGIGADHTETCAYQVGSIDVQSSNVSPKENFV